MLVKPGEQSLGLTVQQAVLSKSAISDINKFSAKQWHLHEGNCDTLMVIQNNHQLPCSNIISNDKNVFLKAQRTYYPLIFNL